MIWFICHWFNEKVAAHAMCSANAPDYELHYLPSVDVKDVDTHIALVRQCVYDSAKSSRSATGFANHSTHIFRIELDLKSCTATIVLANDNIVWMINDSLYEVF
jgi:hypothetical protein